jgi:hypothetical protein
MRAQTQVPRGERERHRRPVGPSSRITVRTFCLTCVDTF